MKNLRWSALVTASLIALANVATAHGGTYRGPPDIVPPNPGGGNGGRSPGSGGPITGPTGPTVPGPSGPTTGGGVTTGGGRVVGGARGGVTGRGSLQLVRDLTVPEASVLGRLKPPKNFRIHPGDKSRFVIVFTDVRASIAEFTTRVLRAERQR